MATPPNQTKWILLRPPVTGPTHAEALRGKRPNVFVPKSEEAVVDAWHEAAELVVAKVSKGLAMLVTQTCDLDWRKHYQVAPIKDTNTFAPEKMASLRNDEIRYWYYLPSRPPELPNDCYADLTTMTSVHKSYFDEAEILCRLTNTERTYFQKALADFHGSPFGFNTRDVVREAGRYSCVDCFHSGFKTTRYIAAGQQFPECRRCGAGALWVMLADS